MNASGETLELLEQGHTWGRNSPDLRTEGRPRRCAGSQFGRERRSGISRKVDVRAAARTDSRGVLLRGIRMDEARQESPGGGSYACRHPVGCDRDAKRKKVAGGKIQPLARWPMYTRKAGRTCYWSAAWPSKRAAEPSSSSMRRSWLYLAMRSVREAEPVLIWPAAVATARSAMKVSSDSPDR
jgi:hypothetical protein